MDSLKLDRFRKLLNRQNTNLNLTDNSVGIQTTSSNLRTSTSVNNEQAPPATVKADSGVLSNSATITQSSISAITFNLPDYITRDNPQPSHFIARKLFSDFVELANRKIEIILSHEQDHIIGNKQKTKDHSLYKTLQRSEDLFYDQILSALGSISEYCLPSLLRLLLLWYHHQIGAYNETRCLSNPSSNDLLTTKSVVSPSQDSIISQEISTCHNNQQLTSDIKSDPAECGCISPCNTETHATSYPMSLPSTSILRSPTPDIINNSVLSLIAPNIDGQTPASLGTPIQREKDDIHLSSSAANTSTSTATNTSFNSTSSGDTTNQIKLVELIRTRTLLIEYTFCQALIEIFGRLHLHPGNDDLIKQIEDIAFEHFKHNEEHDLHRANESDIRRLADKYAEVLGVLVHTRFKSVRKRFFTEFNDLRKKEYNPSNIQSICSLLNGMKHFRVKMAPIEEFEISFQFLQELADYFIEVRHKSIKHAIADLFVEIMLPLSLIVKNEVKIPCLKNFFETLWSPALEMCARKKHSATFFPLVTCLLCVSQRAIFLQNWTSFLSMCLANLKNRDQKMCRIALESLYRLIWIYMIRIKGESNTVTQGKLTSIVDSLFPRGSRQIVPRDTPLVIFVDIIQFIAQERLDFALRHIIFDLLFVDRPIKMVTAPERMNIGLQAFLVIADNLQQKEGDTTMPISIGSASAQQLAQILHSNSSQPYNSFASNNQQQFDGSTYGSRRARTHKMLTDESARSIGLHPYYGHIQKSFNDILKALDTQFGRPLMLTSSQLNNKETEEMISGDRKLKVDLFKTCIAAIPRLMPYGMSKAELVDLLSRMTIHIDEEMRRCAFESLQKLVIEFQDWRLDAIEGFTLFLANQIDESLRNLVDSTLKMLLQLLVNWHAVITSSKSLSSDDNNNNNNNNSVVNKTTSFVTIQTGYETISSRNSGTGGQIAARKNRALAEMRLIQSELKNTRFDRLVNVIQKVEGASLVMLCSCHNTTRKLASLLLRECRSILKCYSSWACMEQYGFKSPDDVEEEDLSVCMKGSLSADNLSRITTTSLNGLAHSSLTSVNTTQAMLSTSISKMCMSTSGGGQSAQCNTTALESSVVNNDSSNNTQHDLYDEDIENNLADYYTSDENSTLIFWIAVMLLDGDKKEQEYAFAFRLLRKILPNLPFEHQGFLDELNRNLKQMTWDNYPGLHALVLKGCTTANTYDLCISLLDYMTPLLKHSIITASTYTAPDECLPAHVFILATYLLSTYEDPPSFSLNIARRLALCCEEKNQQKLENLSAVMTLYSRRSFSKDSFQWIRCIVKYLNDAYPTIVPSTIPLLIDLLETGPNHIQRLVLPMLYCILTYVDIEERGVNLNTDLMRLYNKCLGLPHLWRDTMLILKLIISKSSFLTTTTNTNTTSVGVSAAAAAAAATLASGSGVGATTSTATVGHELPGRTMDFDLDIESLPVIGKSRLAEFGATPTTNNVSSPSQVGATTKQLQQQQQQQQQQQTSSVC